MPEQYRKVKSIGNVRVFSYKYFGHNNRVKITDKWFKKTKTIPYDYTYDSAAETAVAYLMEQGFDVAGRNSEEQIIVINGWTTQELK